MGFAALTVVGDGDGRVGMGKGKSKEVPVAVQKAMDESRRKMVKVNLKNGTLHHAVIGRHGAAKVYMQPASEGTGIIAGGSVRAVLESVGIKDILTKSMGSSNRINVAKATIIALSRLKDPKEELAKRRGTPKEAGPAATAVNAPATSGGPK